MQKLSRKIMSMVLGVIDDYFDTTRKRICRG